MRRRLPKRSPPRLYANLWGGRSISSGIIIAGSEFLDHDSSARCAPVFPVSISVPPPRSGDGARPRSQRGFFSTSLAASPGRVPKLNKTRPVAAVRGTADLQSKKLNVPDPMAAVECRNWIKDRFGVALSSRMSCSGAEVHPASASDLPRRIAGYRHGSRDQRLRIEPKALSYGALL